VGPLSAGRFLVTAVGHHVEVEVDEGGIAETILDLTR
jgi:hypothetical protein